MQLERASRHIPLEVPDIPRMDRFYPHCALAVVELYARRVYGVRDLKQIWFGNTFNYQRPGTSDWLSENGGELNATFGLDGDVAGKAYENLRRYHRIDPKFVMFTEVDAVLDEVHATLGRGVPALSTFDMSLLPNASRSYGRVQQHMIGVFALDLPNGTMRAMDQLRGALTIPVSQYSDSLKRFEEQRVDFFLLRCERDGDEGSLPLDREAVLEDVRAAVSNLYSPEPSLGLSALRALADDVRDALAAEQRPFVVPGQWVISHDRHTLRRGLGYWKDAGIGTGAQIEQLDRLLGQSFALWFQVHMTIERAMHDKDVARMGEALEGIRKTIPLEEAIAAVLAQVADMPTAEAHGNA